MIIRDDELNRIAIDRFVSTSGLWLSVLAERFEPQGGGLRGYYILILNAATKRVRKIYRLCVDDKVLAYLKWEDWRSKFAAKSEYMQEEEIPAALSEIVYQPPYLTEEDRKAMLKMRPKGARLFVRDITPVDEVTARAEQAGLAVVVAEENKPRPTTAIVLALGTDPLCEMEGYKVGDIIMFGKHAGDIFTEDGQSYRSIELHQIIGSRRPEEELDLPRSQAAS